MPGPRRRELIEIGRRGRQVLLLAALTGAVTGASVAGFEWVTGGALNRVLRAPLALRALAPLVGLLAATAVLRLVGGGWSSATADEYIRAFHDRARGPDVVAAPARVLASVATLGLGGAMGFEGPSMYIGAVVGTVLQRRFIRLFSREDAKLLMVAGAAAGVAAIFKAPATGAVFALEVPFRGDLARRRLLPALIGAASGYVAFAAYAGTAPLLPVRGTTPFSFVDLSGAALLGGAAGLGARAFAWLLRRAKAVRARAVAAGGVRPVLLSVGAGAGLAVLALMSQVVLHDTLSVGAGYDSLRYALAPGRSLPLLATLLVVRALATAGAVAGGGAGGLFIPLVVEGAVLGALAGRVGGAGSGTLFPVIGIAAFLGAGYRVPLAGVTFVAEFTGRPGFVVPALIAAVVADLIMGESSVTAYQESSRPTGHLERRVALSVSAALEPDGPTARPEMTVAELVRGQLITSRQHTVPVVDGGVYVGMVGLDEVRALPPERWGVVPVAEIMRSDVPTAHPDWRLADALLAMGRADVDRLGVTDHDGRFLGAVTTSAILGLDQLLADASQAGEEEPDEGT